MPGDDVLVRRDDGGKIDTPYHCQPHNVVSGSGSMVTVKSPEGVICKRNISSVKKYMPRDSQNEVAQKSPRATDPEGQDDIS